jgi:hypothetical protein
MTECCPSLFVLALLLKMAHNQPILTESSYAMGIITDRHKFAAISLYGSSIVVQFSSEIQPACGLVATPNLPFAVTPWWKEQLGSLTCEEIENSGLYLVAFAPSADLKVLDGENHLLVDKCRNFFYGLLLVTMVSPEVVPQLSTGSVEAGEATFRQIRKFELPKAIAGVRLPPISEDAILRASTLAARLEEIASESKFDRIMWALNCFMNGLVAGHVYEKQLSFIRTVEAFLLPDQGQTKRQFKSRTELFLGPSQQQLAETIYDVRSCIEHLHDPLQFLEGMSER